MNLFDLVGLLAASLTTLAFLPQVLKTYRSRQVRDLSLSMTLMLCLGVLLWLVYGIYKSDIPLVVANGSTLLLVLALLGMKLRWSGR
ncbi:MAG: SemiSWEET transporter [Bacteroidetes bacterium]|nr:SemiSWEET transporter [Bacteroidota bacterium]